MMNQWPPNHFWFMGWFSWVKTYPRFLRSGLKLMWDIAAAASPLVIASLSSSGVSINSEFGSINVDIPSSLVYVLFPKMVVVASASGINFAGLCDWIPMNIHNERRISQAWFFLLWDTARDLLTRLVSVPDYTRNDVYSWLARPNSCV